MQTAPIFRCCGDDQHAMSLTHTAYAELLQAHEDASAFGQPLLTEAGFAHVAQRLITPQGLLRLDRGSSALLGPLQLRRPRPRWDADGHRLWLAAQLLKEFRQPAPNQTTLLVAFEEQGWATHVEDPLPLPEGEQEEDARRRLHDTIKNLNRGLPSGTIRFRGDGTGQGVVWEYNAPAG